MNILVTGVNGYVGGHLVLYLLRKGHAVWGLVRPNASEEEVKALKELGVRIMHNDLEGNSRLDLEKGQIQAVIHLLGSIREPAYSSFRSVHEGKTRFLTTECRRLGVKKLVYLGTLGASHQGVSEYLRSKWLAEEEIRNSGMDYVILRSPLIFGKSFGVRESKVIAQLKETILNKRKIPIFGSGKNLFQPIFIGDLVRCLEMAAADPALRNEEIDLGGPEKISFETLLDVLAQKMGVKKGKIKIPFPIGIALAHVLARFASPAPITPDQVRMMQVSFVSPTDRMNQLFGPPQVRFKDGV